MKSVALRRALLLLLLLRLLLMLRHKKRAYYNVTPLTKPCRIVSCRVVFKSTIYKFYCIKFKCYYRINNGNVLLCISFPFSQFTIYTFPQFDDDFDFDHHTRFLSFTIYFTTRNEQLNGEYFHSIWNCLSIGSDK